MTGNMTATQWLPGCLSCKPLGGGRGTGPGDSCSQRPAVQLPWSEDGLSVSPKGACFGRLVPKVVMLGAVEIFDKRWGLMKDN